MKSLFFILALSVSFSSLATEIYFTKDRMDRFACQVGISIKNAYPNQTLRGLRKKTLSILRKEINPWVDANPIPAGFSLPDFVSKLTGIAGFPMDRSEYWMPNAYILLGNPKLELKTPSENYWEAFMHLARLRHVNYLNGETPRFNLRNEENLLAQLEAHLPFVANYAFPFVDDKGLPIEQRNTKKPYTLVIGNPKHKKFDEFVVEASKFNEFASPLVVWLLGQADYSVTPENLFAKTLEMYSDPMTALGVIAWITSGDALMVDRGTSSVVTHKMERLIAGNDVPGFQYHFWGYLTQGFIGNKLRVGALAYIYEKLYQKDIEDWTIDALSLKTSTKIRSAFRHPERCRN